MQPQLPTEPPRPVKTGAGAPRVRPAILAYGFRPFFLLTALHASLALPLWMLLLYGPAALPAGRSPLAWHAHEMLFGFVVAAMAGFMLTAVPSWTGTRGYAGAPLLALVVLWLAGRLAMLLPGAAWPALLDLAFVPALASMLLPALLRSGNRRNLVFLLLLLLMFVANLRFHLAGGNGTAPLTLALDTVMLLVALVGGRILPAFTSAALKQRGQEARIARLATLERAVLAAVAAVLVLDLLLPGSRAVAWSSALAALLIGWQLVRWQGYRCLRLPIVWVLHLGYAWLPVSLLLKAAWLFGLMSHASAWVHALTVGAFATMILGVMTRAALGHTGRPLVAPRGAVAAYALLSLAALVRVFGPLAVPGANDSWLLASASSWSLAFVAFLWSYAPILCRPRIDGKPG